MGRRLCLGGSTLASIVEQLGGVEEEEEEEEEEFPVGGQLDIAAGSTDGNVRLWNLTNPAHPTKLGQPLTGPTNAVDSVAFSPGRNTLAVASSNRAIWFWNIPPNVLTGPAWAVTSVVFSPGGKTLAAGSDDGKVWLWDLTNPAHPTKVGQPLTGPTDPAGIVNSVAFSPGGKTLTTGGAVSTTQQSAEGSGDGIAQMWNLNVDYAIERICATTGNTLTPGRWKQYISQLPYDPPCAQPGHYGLLIH